LVVYVNLLHYLTDVVLFPSKNIVFYEKSAFFASENVLLQPQ